MFEARYHELLKAWIVEDMGYDEIVLHPNGRVLKYESQAAAEADAKLLNEENGLG